MNSSEENEKRRKILEHLVKKSGGIAAFCREYSKTDAEKQISPAFISQLLNKYRTFGEKAARNLEKQAELEKYFFDQFKQPGMHSIPETINLNKLKLVNFIMSLPDDSMDERRVELVKSSCLINKRFIDGSIQILHAINQLDQI